MDPIVVFFSVFERSLESFGDGGSALVHEGADFL